MDQPQVRERQRIALPDLVVSNLVATGRAEPEALPTGQLAPPVAVALPEFGDMKPIAVAGLATAGDAATILARTDLPAHASDPALEFLIAKRLFDLAICVALLPVAVIVLAATAIAIRLDSRGPIVFAQTRVGRDGREFRLYKLRTLRADYDPRAGREFMQLFVQGAIALEHEGLDAAVNKPISDDSITRVGRFLRRTSLDELPQLWNVVRGEMSLIGPRPNVPWEVDAYAEWHRERLRATPGITGLAQVRGRSALSFDAIAQSDVEYVRNRTIWLDLCILWWTVACLVRRDGAG